MKRATFRLQPVLELRRTQERAAASAAAEAANGFSASRSVCLSRNKQAGIAGVAPGATASAKHEGLLSLGAKAMLRSNRNIRTTSFPG